MLPLIDEGLEGALVVEVAIANVFVALFPHELDAATVIVPAPPQPIYAVIEFVPVPVIIVSLLGSTHVYDVAPETAATEYDSVVPGTILDDVPEIVPGVAGDALHKQ